MENKRFFVYVILFSVLATIFFSHYFRAIVDIRAIDATVKGAAQVNSNQTTVNVAGTQANIIIKEFVHDGCTYLYFYDHNKNYIIHKANCKNHKE